MKRLTATFPDGAAIPLEALAAIAIDLKIETVGEAAKPTRTLVRKSKNGKRMDEEVMSHFTPCGSFSIETARKWIADAGFNPHSTSPCLSKLAKLGKLRQSAVKSGVYIFAQK